MKTNHIARFEALVERLVEGTFARLFGNHLQPTEVANALARAMEDHAVERIDAPPLAPNYYRVDINTNDYNALTAKHPKLAAELADILFKLAQQAGFVSPRPPEIHVMFSETIPRRQAQIGARWLPPSDPDENTREMPLATVRAQAPLAHVEKHPFLILEGRRHIPLQSPTVSLGRSLDNTIVIDDSRVSRQHAQLRLRQGRYVIYDLGSSGGSSVNSYPVAECVLEPGDVISLAGVEIIYGQDAPAMPHEGQKATGTATLPPPPRAKLPQMRGLVNPDQLPDKAR